MAIANYSDLVTAIGDDLARSDLASFVPDFIMQAEQVFNHGSEAIDPLRVRDMETVVSLTPVSNVYTLPSDYLQYRKVTELAGSRRPLDYMEPKATDEHYPLRTSGPSNHFTIIGDSLYTFPLSTNDAELVYYAAVPALTDSAPTNWLITKAPSLYLRMSLMFAASFIKDEAETAKIKATIAKLADTMTGDNRRLINIAMDDLGFETQAFAHRRMDQSIKKVLSGRNVDDIKMGEDA